MKSQIKNSAPEPEEAAIFRKVEEKKMAGVGGLSLLIIEAFLEKEVREGHEWEGHELGKGREDIRN